MSEAPSQLPPPHNPAVVRAVATATYLAAIIALWGFGSLLLGGDVVGSPIVDWLLVPAMAFAACVATWFSLARSGRMALWVRALASAVLAHAGMLLVVFAFHAIGASSVLWEWMPLVLVVFAINPFVIAAALLSGVTVLLTAAFTRREGKKRLSSSK